MIGCCFSVLCRAALRRCTVHKSPAAAVTCVSLFFVWCVVYCVVLCCCAVTSHSRLLRGGVGPELNHIVYVIGEGGQEQGAEGGHSKAAHHKATAEMASFVAFAKAFAAAGTSSYLPLPEAVVVTRGVHACVEADMVREGWRE